MSARRRKVALVLLLLFVVMPVIEIVVLIQVGQAIGGWWTVLLLVLGWFAGAWVIKRAGRRAWRALREQVESGRMPSREIADGVLMVLGGVFLMSPGFVSDVVGVLLILPFTRPLFRGLLTAYATNRVVTRARSGPFGPAGPAQNGPRPGPDVVQGEVVEDDERP